MCELKTVNIKGKEYVEVNERIRAFRTLEQYKGYSLESEIVELNNGVITIKAIIKDNNGVIKATGLAQEKEDITFINKTSFVENCETSAWGRALGNLGIGIDTSVASAEEVTNAINNQDKQSKSKTQAKTVKKDVAPTLKENNDIDIFEGLKACSDLDNLKKYYTEQYNNVVDKKAFEKLKDEMKGKLYV